MDSKALYIPKLIDKNWASILIQRCVYSMLIPRNHRNIYALTGKLREAFLF